MLFRFRDRAGRRIVESKNYIIVNKVGRVADRSSWARIIEEGDTILMDAVLASVALEQPPPYGVCPRCERKSKVTSSSGTQQIIGWCVERLLAGARD